MPRKKRDIDGGITKLGHRRYRIRVTVGYDPLTGKQIRESKTIRGSETDARRMKDRMNRAKSGVSALIYGKMPVAEFTEEEWLPTRDIRPTTLAGYKATIRNHIRPLFGTVSVGDATPLFISKMLKLIPDPGARLNTYKMLRSVFNVAVDNRIRTDNPIDGISAPKLGDYDAEIYTFAEVLAALAAVRGRDFEAGMILAGVCGLRASETCAVDWTDMTLERDRDTGAYWGEVSIDEGYHQVGGERVTTPTKSRRSRRVVAIPGFAVRRLLEIRGGGRLGPLMVDSTGQRMTPSGFGSRWRRFAKPRHSKAGTLTYAPPVRYIELKNFRHSRITFLIDELGATLHDASLDAGHGSERVTDGSYNKASRRKRANHALAERIDKAARSTENRAAGPNSS